MAADASMQNMARALTEIAARLKEQNRILETLNQNVVVLGNRLTTPEAIQAENAKALRLAAEVSAGLSSGG